MKKTTLVIAFYFYISIFNYAQVKFDTLTTLKVGPGITRMDIVETTNPWDIRVIKVDLTNPFITLETVKANDRLLGNEKTTSMASRKSFDGHRVIAAINGDFYGGGGVPINTQVINGEILQDPSHRSTISFNANNKPVLNPVSYSGELITLSGTTQIHGTNKTRGTDQLILYNSFFSSTTSTNQFGTEIIVEPLQDWMVNDTITCVITTKEVSTGNINITGGNAVLSGHGASSDLLNNLSVGDTVKVLNQLLPGLPGLKELMGGYPKIISDGLNYVDQGFNEEGGPPHTYERHPRTAIGFSADSSRLYLVTVDGRQASSAGMTLHELADFMIDIGVAYGMNLDGGGSTTMVLRDKIINSVSGGSERAVANAVLVVSSATQGELNEIQVSPKFQKVFIGESVQFNVAGYDEHYNPVEINQADVQYSLSDDFGSINSSGLFTAGTVRDTGYLYVDFNGFQDTAMVIVKSIEKISISPKDFVADTFSVVQFKMSAWDLDNISRQLESEEFNWESTNTDVGVIDSKGIFSGKSPGSTKVIVSYDYLADTAFVNVEINEGTVVLSSFENLSQWIFNGENIDMNQSSLEISNSEFDEGTGSFKIDYNFTYDPTKLYWVYLTADIPIAGVPDSININVKSDGKRHHVQYLLSDDNDELFRLNTKKWAEETDFFDKMPGSFSDVSPEVSGFFNFPVTLKEIQLKLDSEKQSGEVYNGTIYLDNLRISYPDGVTSVYDLEELPGVFTLSQNYPNPFNPSTVINWYLAKGGKVSLKIYDLLGREIQTLINEYRTPGKYETLFNGDLLPSGVYFYRIVSGNYSDTKKMMLLK